jgi:bacillolysin
VYIINGKIIEGLNFSAQPVYSESQARNLAIASIGASQYAWESTTWEQGLKDDKGDPNATYYPTGILTITNLSGTSVETSNFRLTWKFEIFAISPSSQQTVYVNAITGAVLKTIDMGRNNGPAGTLFDGTQTIDTKWFGGFHGHHHLETDDNGKKIQTKNGSYSEGWDALNHVYDNDDTWGLDVPTVRTTGAHWVISRSWDFYKDT